MRNRSMCAIAALTGLLGVTALSGCASSKQAPMALADSELRFNSPDSAVAMGGDWSLAGDNVGLWLLDAGDGGQSPMILAFAADGGPEFIAGDSLGMLLVTGNITALATVLETGELD